MQLIPFLEEILKTATQAYTALGRRIQKMQDGDPRKQEVIRQQADVRAEKNMISRLIGTLNTEYYRDSAKNLKDVNAELVKVLDDLDSLDKKLKAITKVANAVTSFLSGVVQPLIKVP